MLQMISVCQAQGQGRARQGQAGPGWARAGQSRPGQSWARLGQAGPGFDRPKSCVRGPARYCILKRGLS